MENASQFTNSDDFMVVVIIGEVDVNGKVFLVVNINQTRFGGNDPNFNYRNESWSFSLE
jgi:hypothetical protein